MKKLLLALIAFFAFSFAAFAAVDLNTASKEELDAVKYIGPVKAQAIIDYRKKNGPFKSVDELKNVKGFGDKTVAKVRSDLTVGGGASFSPSPAAGKKETKSSRDDAKTTKADSKPANGDAKNSNAGGKHGKADNKSVNGDAAKDAKAGADNVKQSKAEKKAAKKKAKEEKKAAKAKAKEDKKAADKK